MNKPGQDEQEYERAGKKKNYVIKKEFFTLGWSQAVNSNAISPDDSSNLARQFKAWQNGPQEL